MSHTDMNNIFGSVPKITQGGSVIRGSSCRLLDAGISVDWSVEVEMAMQGKREEMEKATGWNMNKCDLV